VSLGHGGLELLLATRLLDKRFVGGRDLLFQLEDVGKLVGAIAPKFLESRQFVSRRSKMALLAGDSDCGILSHLRHCNDTAYSFQVRQGGIEIG